MSRIKQWSLAVVGMLALVTAHPALARPLDDILKSGTLKVGVNPTLPPLGKFDDKNEIVGFDVDFATEIAKMLGVKLEIVQVGSPDRIPFVASGKIDLVMGAMTRNPERAKVIDFTVPVHTEVFGVLTTEAKPYNDWKELDDRRRHADPGARHDADQVHRGQSPARPRSRCSTTIPTSIRALAQGRGDAMIDVIDFVGEQMNSFKDVKWKVVETPVDVYYCELRRRQEQLRPEGLAQRRDLRDAPPRQDRRDLEEVVRHRDAQPDRRHALFLMLV